MLIKLEELESECHSLKAVNDQYSSHIKQLEEALQGLEQEKHQRELKHIDPENDINSLHTISSFEAKLAFAEKEL